MSCDSSAIPLIFAPVPAGELHEIRAAGLDEAGNRLTAQTGTGGGSPLRCCPRESRRGGRVLLIACTPPGTSGACAGRGAVFVHADPCGGYPPPHLYPPELRGRRQVVRAYSRRGQIADGVPTGDGGHAMAVICQMLTRPDAGLVPLRNVGDGRCNFPVRRG